MFPGLSKDDMFADRREAGQALAKRLSDFAGRPDVIVLALPRGGVPVGYEVAVGLGVPLDIFLVRKLGVPQQPELAMGAIASGSVRVLNPDVITWFGLTPETVDTVAARELEELHRRDEAYREGRARPVVHGKTVILVDDGLATGSTMRAAVKAVRQLRPARVIVAVPVGAAESCSRQALEADDVLCLRTPEPFEAVGAWYLNFPQTSDDEVITLLRASSARAEPSGGVT